MLIQPPDLTSVYDVVPGKGLKTVDEIHAMLSKYFQASGFGSFINDEFKACASALFSVAMGQFKSELVVREMFVNDFILVDKVTRPAAIKTWTDRIISAPQKWDKTTLRD